MKEIISNFKNKKVLIVGDVMIDAYIIGKVERVSPEAPVPVVNVEKNENRLGGAANVALNIQALGAYPIMCSVIGNDPESEILFQCFKNQNLTLDGIIQSDDRKTTIKTRVLGNKHQLLRIDNEITTDLSNIDNSKLIDFFASKIKECDVVILEDYNKGVLNINNINKLIEIANQYNKPIAVDPKKNNFLAYRNVTLFKPNLKELKEGLNSDKNLKQKDNLIEAVNQLHEVLNNDMCMVTLSEDGVFITDFENNHIIPAHLRNIADVSGAGDTVISVASLCLACGVDPYTTAYLSNLAGGLVCEENGVVPIDLGKLNSEIELTQKS